MARHWLWPHLWGDLCSQHAGVFSECSIQTWSHSLFLSPPSHPNRVPLPGHERGVEWGSRVNQGSWIYGWQNSLPPWAPVSSMRLWPLGGMGLTLRLLCVYSCVFVWCSSCHNRQEQYPCPAVALSSTAGAGWTRVLDVDGQCHGEDVWKFVKCRHGLCFQLIYNVIFTWGLLSKMPNWPLYKLMLDLLAVS